MKYLKRVALLTVVAVISGCAVPAPKYQPSKENIELIAKKNYPSIGVMRFEDKEGGKNKKLITIRSVQMNSPYEDSYARYIEEAIKLDLMLADRYSSNAATKIDGVLIQNEMNGGGINAGDAVVEVEVSVVKDNLITFKKNFKQTHEWESSFLGAHAIPKAMEQYPILIEKLIGKIFADSEFSSEVSK